MAARSVGAVAGDMIAIHNVVAASATVGLMGIMGLMGRQGLTLRRTVIPMIYCLVLAGTPTMISMYMFKIGDPLLGLALK